MRIKKFMSVILVVALMFSFCSFFVSAESVKQIFSSDFQFEAYGASTGINNITSSISKSNSTFNSKSCTVFKIPLATGYSFRQVGVYYNLNLQDSHNYNLNFYINCDVPTSTQFLVEILYFDYNGHSVGEQVFLNRAGTSSDVTKWIEINANFTPDSTKLSASSYQQIMVSFTYEGTVANNCRISEIVVLTDKDDNSSWFEKIINAIKEIPSNFVNGIRNFFENLGNKISELGDNIQSFFVELGENIGEFFTMLKNYLLYFQHPVTTNSDGVLVDGSGKPVYTNPFDSAMNSVKNTVNSWLLDIDEFISDIDSSRQNVKAYIETGSGVINDVLGASPLLSAAVIFAAAFLVIRKVVGR